MKYINNSGYKFADVGGFASKRALSLFDKEPETIKWIDTFTKNDTFIDIGANVGCYTIYAANKCKDVISIEPHPGTYNILLENIIANEYKNVLSINVGVSDKTGFQFINYTSSEPGCSDNQLGSGGLDYRYCLSLEDVFRVTYGISECSNIKLKIDVDGLEFNILYGLRDINKWNIISEILCEYNPGYLGDQCIKILYDHGYYIHEQQLTKGGKKLVAQGKDIQTIPHNLLFRKSNAT